MRSISELAGDDWVSKWDVPKGPLLNARDGKMEDGRSYGRPFTSESRLCDRASVLPAHTADPDVSMVLFELASTKQSKTLLDVPAIT